MYESLYFNTSKIKFGLQSSHRYRYKSLRKSDHWLETKTDRVVISLFPKQPIGGSQESKFLKSSFYGNVRLY